MSLTLPDQLLGRFSASHSLISMRNASASAGYVRSMGAILTQRSSFANSTIRAVSSVCKTRLHDERLARDRTTTADLGVRWGVSTDDYADYHDTEWGRPTVDERTLFEKICLEGFQSGLSWLTILRKRDNFRAAFDDFDPDGGRRVTRTTTSSASSAMPASSATGARSRRRSTTPDGWSNCTPAGTSLGERDLVVRTGPLAGADIDGRRRRR